MGEYFKAKLLNLSGEFPSLVKEVRGYGLMIGVELTRPGDPSCAMRERNISSIVPITRSSDSFHLHCRTPGNRYYGRRTS